jgi:hypothetical protein
MRMTGIDRQAGILVLFCGLYGLSISSPFASSIPIRGFGTVDGPLVLSCGEEKLLFISVPGNTPWTDTGLEVISGQEISFEAEGKISLQRGNPEAECGPDGYDLQTVQQPISDRNLGALIGKVVISVTVAVNEKTKAEKKDEVAELFYVGSKSRVEMPVKGRLYLGINENVIGDNAGEYKVKISVSKGLGPASLQD